MATAKKKPGVESRRSTMTSASAKEAAYGKKEVVYEKAKKPKKNVNSSDYQGLTNKEKNTKVYSSSSDATSGQMVKTLKNIGKAKVKNLTNKEAVNATENPKAKGKNFTKATISNVDKEAYDRVAKRAAASGLSAKDTKKAVAAGIRTTSAGLKSDRDKVAMRFKMQEMKNKKAAQDKIKRGY